MIIAAFVIIMAASLLCFLFATRPEPQQATLTKRVQTIRSSNDKKERSNRNQSAQPGTLTTDRFEVFISSLRIGKMLSRLIAQAGSNLSITTLLLWTAVGALTAALVCGFFFNNPISCPIALIGVTLLPYFLLRRMRTARVAKFEAALPDAIDLMSRSLRAGHSVSSALEIISEQAVQPLAGEFWQVSQQQRLGVMFRDSLGELAERVPSQDLLFLITAMLVQRENGGDLTEILDRTGKVISERMRIAGEVRIYSAQGRLTGWILSALPVVLLLLMNIANPSYSKVLFSDPTGRIMLYGAGLSIVIGILTIRRIVDIKV